MWNFRHVACRLAAAASALCLVLSANGARAQTEAELERARDEFNEAIALQTAGDCAAALQKLKQVARLKPTPQVRFNIALCEERLGKLVAALGNYRISLEESEAAAIDEVAEPARQAITKLEQRVPRLKVVRGPGAESASIRLDGTPLGDAAIGPELRRDPGPHSVAAAVEGRPLFHSNFRLSEGEIRTIVVRAQASARERETRPVPAESQSTKRTLGIVAGGVGIASMVLAGVFVFLRQDALDELDARCDGYRCPGSAQPAIDRGRLYTGLAEGAALLGVAGVGLGAVLLLGSDGGGSPGAGQARAVMLRGRF
jgi:hypothetical protein